MFAGAKAVGFVIGAVAAIDALCKRTNFYAIVFAGVARYVEDAKIRSVFPSPQCAYFPFLRVQCDD